MTLTRDAVQASRVGVLCDSAKTLHIGCFAARQDAARGHGPPLAGSTHRSSLVGDETAHRYQRSVRADGGGPARTGDSEPTRGLRLAPFDRLGYLS